MKISRMALPFVVMAFAACKPIPPGSSGSNPSGGGAGINPGACGTINTSNVGRKVHSFLTASAELDRASIELEQSVHQACVKMAQELQIPTTGNTEELCGRVSTELEASLQVSVSQEQRLVTRTEPPVCTTEIDFAAGIVAECEASVRADVSIRCDGYCGATCNGVCNGTCSSTNADGSCAGSCDGVCEGSCSGSCQGNASVDASAECKASAEVRASINTTCSEPKVVVVTENVTVIDATKLDRAVKAIEVGMPTLLQVGAKAKLVGGAFVYWSKTAVSLAASSADLVADLGANSICVGLQLAGAVAASADISARIDVSISVSASVSASAGAQ